jgi:hypothetical protein
MTQKYNEMNQLLFDNELGSCTFRVFTRGKGSQGGVLGWFGFDAKNVKTNTIERRLFVIDLWSQQKTYINKDNFVSKCRPYIELNGNYSATEEGWLNTLIHEMCHYYTYMYGKCPKQAHGPEFRRIASYISYKSNGTITIERLANAEKMSNFELDDEFKEKEKRRLDTKINKLQAIFVFTKNGDIELTTSTIKSVIDEVILFNAVAERADNCEKILLSTDPRVINALVNMGYRKSFRTYRYWTMPETRWNMIKDYNFKEIPKELPKREPVTFTINENDIRNMVENTIMELINNNEDSIAINPDIPLSELSPFEY